MREQPAHARALPADDTASVRWCSTRRSPGLRVRDRSPAGRILAPVRSGAGADRRSPPHAPLRERAAARILLPAGTIVRRSFSFQRGEKSRVNILYRRVVDTGSRSTASHVRLLFLAARHSNPPPTCSESSRWPDKVWSRWRRTPWATRSIGSSPMVRSFVGRRCQDDALFRRAVPNARRTHVRAQPGPGQGNKGAALTMHSVDHAEVQLKGKAIRGALGSDRWQDGGGRGGQWIKIASIKDEDLVEGAAIGIPETFVSALTDGTQRRCVHVRAEASGDDPPVRVPA